MNLLTILNLDSIRIGFVYSQSQQIMSIFGIFIQTNAFFLHVVDEVHVRVDVLALLSF